MMHELANPKPALEYVLTRVFMTKATEERIYVLPGD
jgi:hypothetical protein